MSHAHMIDGPFDRAIRREEDLLTMTAQIVTAQVSTTPFATNQIADMITGVHAALSSLGKPAEPVVAAVEPAVPISKSQRPDYIICLECGTKAKMLKRHLGTAHDMSPEAYRAKWKLPASYALVAANYAEQRRELAKAIGLGTNRNR